MAYYSFTSGKMRRSNRRSALRRQRLGRSRMVRMSRAGYGASKYRRILSAISSRPELKSVDNFNTAGPAVSLTLNTTAQITALNLISAGSSFFNRVGRRIEMKSLHVSGVVSQTTTATVHDDYGRILVIYDRQTNGALPTISNILASYDQSGASTTSVFSNINPDERERYLVLADIRLALPACPSGTGVTSASDGVTTTFNINRFIKLRNLLTHYKADSAPAVIGDVATGGLYIIGYGGLASGTEGWQATVECRLRYKDT